MEKVNLIDYVTQSYDKLMDLWTITGYDEAAMEKRKRRVIKYSTELFAEMITEEEKRVEEMRMDISERFATIQKLCKDLGEEDPKSNASATLLEQIEALTKILTELQAKKKEKMRLWDELKADEFQIRTGLGEVDAFDAEFKNGIPGNTDVVNLKSKIQELRAELARRTQEFSANRELVIKHFAVLEKLPSNVFERLLITDESMGSLTRTLLSEVSDLCQALEAEIKAKQAVADGLRTEIMALRRRLRLEEGESELPIGFKPVEIEQLITEVARLTELKKANLAKFSDEMRAEISTLSGQVFKVPDLHQAEEPSEELLEALERALETLKAYQAQHHRLIDLWTRRRTMWTKWIKAEERNSDPSRLNNRGGTLLQEQKEYRTLEKSLPKLENEITLLAGKTPDFLVFGVQPQLIIADEWEKFYRNKEEKKAKKQAAGPSSNMTLNVTRKRVMTPGPPDTPGFRTPVKRSRLTPLKIGATRGGIRGGLRSAQSRENVGVSPTYSEFTSHKEIFQSTMVDNE